jgi:hypothetical protein
VPKVAGQLIVIDGRVFIESSPTIGHRALEVQAANRSVQIPIGEGYSPRDAKYDVVVRGTTVPWKLTVTIREQPDMLGRSDASDPPTFHYSLALTDLQRAVLDAYSEPLRQGRAEPATHRDVAFVLNYHPNTVREALYEIWTLMFAQGVPMPDISDKRAAVVEAARVYGVVEDENGGQSIRLALDRPSRRPSPLSS